MAVAPPYTITMVMSDFLGSAPTLEAIIAFTLPAALEARGLELLARSRDGDLTPEERTELDEFTRMGHFMNRVKLQARLKLAEKT
jgi:hypothetical protein